MSENSEDNLENNGKTCDLAEKCNQAFLVNGKICCTIPGYFLRCFKYERVAYDPGCWKPEYIEKLEQLTQ